MTLARPRRRLAALGVLVASLAAACSGSGYRYVQNDDANAYFKLPEQWTVFDEGQILSQPALDLAPLQRRRLVARTWMRGFDAGPQPSPLNVVDLNGPYPRGFAQVQELLQDERSSISLSDLRGIGLAGNDPFEVVEQDEDGPVEILNAQDITFPGGHHGVRMEVAVDAEGDKVVVVDYTAVLDGRTRFLYLFVIGCEESCYFGNRTEIKSIADSWQIEEQ